MARTLRLELPIALATVVAACTFDFNAPFGNAGSAGVGGVASSAGYAAHSGTGGAQPAGSGGTSVDGGGGTSAGGTGGDVAGAGGTAAGGSGAVDGSGATGASSGSGGCAFADTTDRDADGWSSADGDCDDCTPAINPGAFDGREGFGLPGVDDDCNGAIDDGETICDSGLAIDDAEALHAATGWVQSQASVAPGSVITVLFAVWDSEDEVFDSRVLLDRFERLADDVAVGTEPVPNPR